MVFISAWKANLSLAVGGVFFHFRKSSSAGGPPSQRWAHPGQQQGRRFPSLRLEQPHSIRRLLVSALLADSIQHIHSLRASGVMPSQAVNACGSDVSAFSKSAGTSCTTPLEIFFCDIEKLSFVSPSGPRISC